MLGDEPAENRADSGNGEAEDRPGEDGQRHAGQTDQGNQTLYLTKSFQTKKKLVYLSINFFKFGTAMKGY